MSTGLPYPVLVVIVAALLGSHLIPLVHSTDTTDAERLIADGEIIENSILARRISLPADASAFFSGNITLEALEELRIEGVLKGTHASTATSRLTLIGSTIHISGAVVAPDGRPGEDATGSPYVAAENGTDGGALRVSWGAEGKLMLTEGAVLRSGSGGGGGSARFETESTDIASRLDAVGGTGGNGGDIILEGGAAILHGQIVIGNGGSGGDALGAVAVHTPMSVETATTRGGAGGASGTLVPPPGYTILSLYDSGILEGGRGGEGGIAYGTTFPSSADASCEQTLHSDGIHGPAGCNGANDKSEGGGGGRGLLIGGSGGHAFATGQDGRNGGAGADGRRSTTTCHGEIVGGDGGRGGNGGNATATGGAGGYGTLLGGRGGNASAVSGYGGHGGPGGGYGHTGPGESCDAFRSTCGTMSTAMCWIDTGDHGCGHGGRGGAGGREGAVSARGGAPGTSVTDLNLGRGWAGSWSAERGDAGVDGDDGSRPDEPCWHDQAHDHIG